MQNNNHATLENSKAKQTILKAAKTLFAEYGFTATRVQMITDAVGVNKAMLFYYFGSKDDLYDIIIQEGISTFDKAVSAAEQDGPELSDRLRKLLTTYLNVVAEQPELARIVYREAVGVGETSRKAVGIHFSESVFRLSIILADAQRNGIIRRDVEPTLVAYSLFGMANMFITRLIVTSQPLEVAPIVEHILDLFLKGVCVQEDPVPMNV